MHACSLPSLYWLIDVEFASIGLKPKSVAYVCILMVWETHFHGKSRPAEFAPCEQVCMDDVLAIAQITSKLSPTLKVITDVIVREFEQRTCYYRESPTNISHTS